MAAEPNNEILVYVTDGVQDQPPRQYRAPGFRYLEVQISLFRAGVPNGIFYIPDPSIQPPWRILHYRELHRSADRPEIYYGINNPELERAFNLFEGVRTDNPEIVRQSLINGANVNTRTIYNNTPINIMRAPDEITNLLLDAGADVNVANDEDDTVLIYAASQDNLNTVRRILQLGADINHRNRYGTTALFTAALNGSLPVVQELINSGAELNVTNASGNTPLHAAATGGYVDIVNALLQAGADWSIRNNRGETVEDTARKYNHMDVVRAIEPYSQVDIKEPDGL